MTAIRCAVIGTGHLGKIHAGLLRKMQLETGAVELCCVVDSELSRASQVAGMFHTTAIDDYRKVLQDIDAAIIATPTTSHRSIASDLMNAGKHCFVEKPLACDMMECRELNRIAAEKQLTLQVGHVENFNPVWKGMRPQLNGVKFIDAVRSGTYTGRSTDIGIVMDLMIHDLDLIAEVVDSSVERVSAFGFNVLSRHEDFAEAHIHFRNGAIARVRASRLDEHLQRTFTAYCEQMVAHLDFANGTARVSELQRTSVGEYADALPYDARMRVKESLFTDWMPTREISFTAENAIEQELKDFVSAINYKVQPLVNGTRGMRAVIMAEQILAAIEHSRSKTSSQALADEAVLTFQKPLTLPLRSAA